MTTSPTYLSPAESEQLREAVAEAVLGVPGGLREALDGDPAAALRLVAASRVAAEEASALLRRSIDGARASGHSWDAVGQVLGVSRQAAQQRFGSSAPPAEPSSQDGPRRKVLSPLTAFTEMAVLEAEGRRGWHVVDYGTLFHVVEASEHQWEHRRVSWGPGVRRRMADDGWQLIRNTAFPWGYYTRETSRPAEPDPALAAGPVQPDLAGPPSRRAPRTPA